MTRSYDECVDLGHGRGRAERSTAEAVWRIDAELGRPADVNEAWRSPEQANANRARWKAYERYLNGGPWAPYAPYALGAEDSVHCDGEAVDSDDWYNAYAAAVWRRHGFRQTARYPGTARDEIWHGEHRDEWEEPGVRDAGGNATPIPREWDEMATRDETKEAFIETFTDKRFTDKLAEAVKNELRALVNDLVLLPIAELGNAMHLFAISTQRSIHVQDPAHVDIIRRATSNRGYDVMSSSEIDIFRGYCKAVYPPVDVEIDVEALSAALASISAKRSAEAVRYAVDDAIALAQKSAT